MIEKYERRLQYSDSESSLLDEQGSSTSRDGAATNNEKFLNDIVQEVFETYGPDEMKLRKDDFIDEAVEDAKKRVFEKP